ncbi:MAG: hypothetical protein NTX15_00695 [Candidatus Kapabacteria bacterium]|nr:hypothetical protein [Candidatus Kapabacteria bacterium]
MITRRRILFICGSMNQTTMMEQISRYLPHCDCWFTPHYTDGLIGVLERRKLIEWTVAGQGHQLRARDYLEMLGKQIDFRGSKHMYDLVVTCSDLIVPKNIRHGRVVLVQEGMTDPENMAYYFVKYLGLPRYLASTSTFGMSDAYMRMCVASDGYKQHFIRKGARAEKLITTGIPNFDNCAQFVQQPIEQSDFVLVATSDARETFKYEHRRSTIERARTIAAGRRLIFKLHPNEQHVRAISEIARWAPEAEVIVGQPIEPLIAQCHTLITKYSSCVYVGIALGKVVYSDFPLETLRQLCPVQNGGRSAENIAMVCDEVVDSLGVRVTATLPRSMSVGVS